MKMRKLLAGILSATMVATMIPASMAFSGVSAEGGSAEAVNAAMVASYDFTTDIGTGTLENATWNSFGTVTDFNDQGMNIGNSTEGTNAYQINNPLKGQESTTGYSVVFNGSLTVGTDISQDSFMGFNDITDFSNRSGNFFSVGTSGKSFHLNVAGTGDFDICSSEQMNLQNGQYVVTVTDETITAYVNGTEIARYNHDETTNSSGWPAHPGYYVGATAYMSDAAYFSLGSAAAYWGNGNVTAASVAFYNTALSADDVTYLYTGEYPAVQEPTEVDVTCDLTTEAGREGWSGYTASNFGATYAEGNTTITEDANGVTFTQAGLNSYSIANPLKGNVTDGFSITVNATIPSEQVLTQFEGFFGFNNHTSWNYWQVSNNGATLQTNSDLAYTNWTGEAPGDNPFYYGIVGAEQNAMRDVEYTLSVDKTGASIYLNGELVATYTEENSDYISAVTLGAANGLNWFNLGFNAGNGDTTSNDQGEPNGWNWFNTRMTVTSVSFSTTPIEDKAQEIADTLELNVRGMQKGTFTPTDGVATQATRFVANLNSEALANDAITMLGWAAEANATTEITNPETATYASVTTVTNDSTLAPEGTFAYTYVVTDGAQTGVVPCVQVTVGGVEFWFSYNGYSGSLESTVDGTNDCQVVAAIEVPDAAFTSTQA